MAKRRRQGGLLKHQVESIYLVRYCEDAWEKTDMIEEFHFRTPMFNNRDDVHNRAIDTPMHWQAATITYCQDVHGKKYRLFGFARTGQAIVAANNGICPVLQSAHEYAEASANQNHVYARGALIAPWTRTFDTLWPVLKKRQSFFKLTDADLEQLRQAEHSPGEFLEYNRNDLGLDLDDQIARLMT